MNTRLWILLLLLSAGWLPAATHLVLPEESIQAVLDDPTVVAGDIVAISGGTYSEDLTITKAVRLVEVDGQEVTLPGSVHWSGVANAPAFEGFAVGSPGKGITVTGTTDLVLKNVDASGGTALTISGTSKVAIVGGTLNGIEQNGGELAVNQATVLGNFITQDACEKTIALRLEMPTPASFCSWRSKRSSIAYSEVKRFVTYGSNGRVVVVACRVWEDAWLDGTNNARIVIGGTGNEAVVVNCVIGRIRWNGSGRGDNGINLYVGNSAEIHNNYIYGDVEGGASSQPSADKQGNGIYSTSSDARVAGNILSGIYRGIFGPFGLESRYNLSTGLPVGGGAFDEGSVSAEPGVTSNEDPTLLPGSPCFDSGDPDPVYNDLDGSRNDIGPSGGPWYDPEGWTTDKPVVISFDLGARFLQEGVDTEVNLENGQAVAQP